MKQHLLHSGHQATEDSYPCNADNEEVQPWGCPVARGRDVTFLHLRDNCAAAATITIELMA